MTTNNFQPVVCVSCNWKGLQGKCGFKYPNTYLCPECNSNGLENDYSGDAFSFDNDPPVDNLISAYRD